MTPFFSIIMPVYNSEKYLKPSLDSILKQTFENFELIIINDGSTDNSINILNQYKASDSRLKVITQENSGSAGAARSAGLLFAKGEYIVIIDSDDWVSNNILSSYYERIKQDSKIDIVVPHVLRITDENEILYEYRPYKNDYQAIISGEFAFHLSINWEINGCACYKKELFKKINISNKYMNSDELTTRKLFSVANKVAYSEGKYFYRVNYSSTTMKTFSAKIYEQLFTTLELFQYAKSIKAKKEDLSNISTNFISQLIHLINKYVYEKKHYSKIELKNLKRLFYSVNKSFSKEMFNLCKFTKFKFLYVLAFGNINVICFYITIIRKLIK